MSAPSSARGAALRMLHRLAVIICGTAFLVWASPAPEAHAHALLVASDPSSGASLARSPRIVSLWFGEKLDRAVSSARLIDERGADVPAVVSTVGVDPSLLQLEVPALATGRYSALWDVTSADDGHRTTGAIVFTVGLAASSLAGDAATGTGHQTLLDVLEHWLAFLALSGALGGLAVLGVVLGAGGPGTTGRTASPRGRGSAPLRLAMARSHTRLMTMVAVSAAGGVLVACAEFAARAATTPGRPVVALLIESVWGRLWLVRSSALVAIMLVMARVHRRSRLHGFSRHQLFIVLLPVGALITGTALNGHASSVVGDVPLAVVADVAHLTAAGVWIGALSALLLLLRLPRRRVILRLGRLRFSVLMASCVAVLILSGVYEAGRQIDRTADLLNTDYGLMVVAKAVLLLLMLALGLANLLGLHEISSHARRSGLRRGRVQAELAIGAAVLGVVAVLVGTAPARVSADATPTGTSPGGTTRPGFAADLLMALTVTPDRPGYNGISVSVASDRRPAPAPITSLDLTLYGSTATMRDLGDGEYFLNATLAEGPTTLHLVVHRAGRQIEFAVPWTQPHPAEDPGSSGGRLQPWTDALTLGGLVAIDLVAAAGLWWLIKRKRPRPAAATSEHAIAGKSP